MSRVGLCIDATVLENSKESSTSLFSDPRASLSQSPARLIVDSVAMHLVVIIAQIKSDGSCFLDNRKQDSP